MRASALPRGAVMHRSANKAGFRDLPHADRVALWLVLCPALVDFRTQKSSIFSVGFYGVLALLLLAGCAGLVLRHGLKPRSSLNVAALVAGAFSTVAILSGFSWGQPVGELLRSAAPLVFFPASLLAISALAASRADARAVWRQVLLAAVAGALIQVLLAIFVRGVTAETVRYEILSGATALITGEAVAVLMFGGLTLSSGLIVAFTIGTVLASVTRTFVVVAAVAAVAGAVAGLQRLARPEQFARRLIGVIVAIVILGGLSAMLPGAPLQRWNERISVASAAHHGVDITAVARLGEARYQIRQLLASPRGALTGFGVAAKSQQDEDAVRITSYILGGPKAVWTDTAIGHNNYVGTLFVGGFLFGGGFLLLQFIGAYRAMSVVRALCADRLFDRFGTLVAPALAYLSYMTFGLFGGTMSSRSAALLFGLTLGLTLWVSEAVRARSGHAPAAQ